MRTLSIFLLLAAQLSGANAVAADVDHQPFDALLKAHVNGERVDYAGLRAKGAEALARYVAVIAETDPKTLPSREARLAFWINAYNALTLHAVIAQPPGLKSVTDVKPDFGFFKQEDKKAGGRSVSLDMIENKIIRPEFGDPRIHAALNCASVSCPPLQPFAFTADKLDAQLDQAMRAFARDRVRNQFDVAGKKVRLSKIFEWYKDDFTKGGGVPGYLARFLEGEEKALVGASPKVEFLEYDWGLNGR